MDALLFFSPAAPLVFTSARRQGVPAARSLWAPAELRRLSQWLAQRMHGVALQTPYYSNWWDLER